MDDLSNAQTDELLQSAHSALCMLGFMSSRSASKYNFWDMQAKRLRAAIDRLKESTSTTDTEAPTRV